MMFARVRRVGAYVGLVAAIGLAGPVGGASAAVPGQPTAITVSPEFASRIASGNVGLPKASGVEVAQNRREVRRERSQARRQFRRQSASSRRDLRRDRYRRGGRDYYVRDGRRYYGNRRYYGRPYYRNGYRHYYGGRWYTWNDDNWYDDGGAIVAAGVIGLAAGALAGAAYSNNTETVVVDDGYGYAAPYSSEWYRLCDRKYRSFRASDGTYLGYDGVRHTCRIP